MSAADAVNLHRKCHTKNAVCVDAHEKGCEQASTCTCNKNHCPLGLKLEVKDIMLHSAEI